MKRVRFGIILGAAVVVLTLLGSYVAAPSAIVNAATETVKTWNLTGNKLKANNFLGSTNNQPLVIKTNNTEKMRVTQSGNVGIGTANPTEKLSIQTATDNFGVLHSDGTAAVGSFVGKGSAGIESGWFGTKTNHPLQLFAGGSGAALTVATNGKVGIGTTAPAQSLQVNGVTSMGAPGNIYGYSVEGGNGTGTFPTLAFNAFGPTYLAGKTGFGGIWQFSDLNGALIYYTSSSAEAGQPHVNTPRFAIRTTGQVGIGTPLPDASATVHIQGMGDGSNTEGLLVTNSDGVLTFRVDNAGQLTIGELAAKTTKQVCINGGGILAECSSAAEYVPSIASPSGFPQAADLVSIAPDTKNPYGDEHSPFAVQKAATACDPNLLGFIVNPESGANGEKLNDHYLPLAIFGYFPAKVTMENGAIKRGDPITSSTKAGYGMKATGACKVIGYALEDASADGTIQVYANHGDNSAAQVTALKQQVNTLEARLAALEAATSAANKPVAVAR